jgi:uncharacterized protein YifN (PemK superfamily)
MREDDLIRTNTDYLLTETTFVDGKIPPETVLKVVRERKTTGELTVHLSQGGIQKIVLKEKTRANEPQRDKIREILGM